MQRAKTTTSKPEQKNLLVTAPAAGAHGEWRQF
jgi:hypothetical protein